jgi:hypothetical protein
MTAVNSDDDFVAPAVTSSSLRTGGKRKREEEIHTPQARRCIDNDDNSEEIVTSPHFSGKSKRESKRCCLNLTHTTPSVYSGVWLKWEGQWACQACFAVASGASSSDAVLPASNSTTLACKEVPLTSSIIEKEEPALRQANRKRRSMENAHLAEKWARGGDGDARGAESSSISSTRGRSSSIGVMSAPAKEETAPSTVPLIQHNSNINPTLRNLNAGDLSYHATMTNLIENREIAAIRREEQIRQKQEQKNRGEETKILNWESADRALGSSITYFNPESLFDMCIKLLVKYSEHIEELGSMSSDVLLKISTAVARKRKLNSKMLELLTPPGITEVNIPDCHLLESDDLLSLWDRIGISYLQTLSLGHCGRCVSDTVLEKLSSGDLRSLTCLTLHGCFQASSGAIVKLLLSACALQVLHISGNDRVDASVISSIVTLNPSLRVLSIDTCSKISNESVVGLKGLRNLVELKLSVPDLADDVCSSILDGSASSLVSVDLSGCSLLTDDIMGEGGLFNCKKLRKVNLDDCKLLTDSVLEVLAANNVELTHLSLRRCVSMTDDGFTTYLDKCGSTLQELNVNSLSKLSDNTFKSIASVCRQLVQLDVSWCRLYTDDGIGYLVDHLPSLRQVTLWGCTQVTERFYKGHNNRALKIIGKGVSH